jgi:hypothetical protein
LSQPHLEWRSSCLPACTTCWEAPLSDQSWPIRKQWHRCAGLFGKTHYLLRASPDQSYQVTLHRISVVSSRDPPWMSICNLSTRSVPALSERLHKLTRAPYARCPSLRPPARSNLSPACTLASPIRLAMVCSLHSETKCSETLYLKLCRTLYQGPIRFMDF